MDFLAQYIVPFRKLGLGKHNLKFKINDQFFEIFSYEEILGANIDVDLNMEVQTKGILMDFSLYGTVRVVCDRCLEEFDMDFKTKAVLNVEFGDNEIDEFDADDTVFISREAGQLNIAKHLFDYIVLGLPIKKVHPNKEDGTPGCDEEMLKFIEEYKPKKTLSNTKDFDKLRNLFT